jgi:hypothetical protein
MNHVFVLTATNFRVPRWFADGLAVHEEGQHNPQWSDRMTPGIVVAFKNKKLLPIAQLDRGFVHQEYPGQVQVSYFQAGRICDFIQIRWGAGTLVEMIHAFAELRPTPQVIQQALGLQPEEFDQQFTEWLTREVGPIADTFDEWRAHLKAMVDFSNKGQKDEAHKEGEAARAVYPQYVWDANPYGFLADIDLAKGDRAAALAVLTDYRKFGGEDPETLKKLASLQEEAGQLPQAAATLDALNDIFPIDADLHRRLGALRLKEHNYPASIREYAAVVALRPLDKAGALYDLAGAYFEAGNLDDAELNVVGSLEAAPGYRPAQKLLLRIEDAHSHRPN